MSWSIEGDMILLDGRRAAKIWPGLTGAERRKLERYIDSANALDRLDRDELRAILTASFTQAVEVALAFIELRVGRDEKERRLMDDPTVATERLL